MHSISINAHFPAARRLLALFLFCLTFNAAALPPEIRTHQFLEQRWGVSDGLPQITSQTVLQSHDGMLWIGTQNGLVRFDGIEFRVFDQDNYPGLVHPYILTLAEDEAGRIWIGTERGVSLFQGGEIRPVSRTDGGDTGPARHILHDPATQRTWIAADRGLFLATPDGLNQPHAIDAPLFGLATDGNGRIFAGGRGELWTVDDSGPKRHRLPGNEELLEIRELAVHDGELWQGTGNDLRVAPLQAPVQWRQHWLRDREVESLLFDEAGNLWVATVSGLFRRPPGADRPESVRTANLSRSEWLRSLYEDREGNLWIGTQGRGLVRLSEGTFRRYAARDGLVDDIVWTLHELPNGELWAGTNEDGAFRMTADGTFEQPIPPEALPHPMTMGFLIDGRGRLWIATRSGIAWFDAETLEPLPVPEEIPETGVFALTEDDSGRVWLASRDGAYWWRDGELRRLGESEGLTQARTRDVLAGPDGAIWIATDTGIFRGGPEGVTSVGEGTEIPDFSASALFNIDGTVWAVLQGALARFPDGEARVYTDDQGLKASVGSFLTLDDEGFLWSTTHEGILRIPISQFDEIDRGERDQVDAEVFGSLDDPVVAQCNGGHGQSGVHQPEVNAIWCPSLQGILRLDTQIAKRSPSAPTPIIRQVRAGGRSWAPIDQLNGNTVVLPPDARDLEIDFSGLHFRYPEGVRYRVRLAGFDQGWQDAGDRRTAFYTNLPPGEYRFQVHARNAAGVESGEPAGITLELQPRYYESTWFQLLALLGLTGLAYLAWRLSVQRLRRRRIALERVVRKRTRQLHELNRQLEQASVTDPLTGLRNRRYLSNQIPHDIAQVDRAYTRYSRNANRDITFLLIDLDHFKRINDECGHRVGDQILTEFAELLTAQLRDADYVIRWGGEEFLVVARNSERTESTVCAERIMTAVRGHHFTTDQGDISCTCSIGIATYPTVRERPDLLGWEDVVELADAANYIAKGEGRDRWVEIVLSPAIDGTAFMRRFREGVKSMVESGEVTIRRERPANHAPPD